MLPGTGPEEKEFPGRKADSPDVNTLSEERDPIVDQEYAPLPRRTPESQGIASAALLAFLEEAQETIQELHSVMLLRHGQVVAEGWWSPYGPQQPHMLFSLSKSFTSTAAGLAVAEGRFSLDDNVLSFFPEDAPAEISANLTAMRVRHLLSMSTGHATDTTGALHTREDGNWVKAFLEQPVEYAPGTHFLYNSGATYMVSAIVQKTTGQRVLDYLGPRLLDPLGITGATWEQCPRGIDVGGWGLNIKTEDIARFGQLYLQKGVWNEQRLLSESWVEEATSKQVSNGDPATGSDWNQGYGFQFWRCRHGAYRGDGAFGQFCVVMPEQEAVLAITAGTGDLQGVLNVAWKHLLPAMQSAPLPEDNAAQAKLRDRLASLVLSTPQGQSHSPTEARVTGKTYRFEANDQKIEALTFDFGKDACVIRIHDQYGEHRIVCGGEGEWQQGEATLNGPEPKPVAATGAWTDENTFVIKLCFYRTPFCPILTCGFEGDQLRLDYCMNVSFGPRERPQLVGRAEG